MEAANQGFLSADGELAGAASLQTRWGDQLILADEAIAGGRLADALDHNKHALMIAQENWPGTPELAESYVRLADVCAALDQCDTALNLYNQGVTVLGGFADGVSPGLAHAVGNLGRLHMLKGEMDKAVELTAAADALLRRLEEPHALAVKLNLALVAATAGRHGEAEQAFIDAMAAAERTRTAAGAPGIAVLDNYARFCVGREMRAEAEMALRRCLILRQESGGPRDPVYAAGLENLARLLLQHEAGEEAETLLWQASEVYRHNDDKPVAGLVSVTHLVAQIALRNENPGEARKLGAKLLELGAANPAGAAAAEAAALHIEARLALDGPDKTAAEAPMRRALAIADNLKGDFRQLGDDIAGDLLCELAELLMQTDKGAEAERLMARAEELRHRLQWIVTGFVFVTP